MNYRLSKIESSHNNLKTSEVVGFYLDAPTVGERFLFFEKLTAEGGRSYRVIDTSPVREILLINHGIILKTLNSTYRLEEI